MVITLEVAYESKPFLTWREVPQPFEARLEIAKNPERRYLEPNCYGTGLFLAGVLPWDVCIFSKYLSRVIKNLDRTEEMQDDSIAIFKTNTHIQHLSYIKKTNPFKGYHREGSCGSFYSMDSLEEVQPYLDALFEIYLKPHYLKVYPWEKEFYVLPKDESKRKELDILAREIIGEYAPSG